MKKTTPTKDDLFWYLDTYAFVWDFEILGAIEDFFRVCVNQDENRQPSYWELLYFQELADEYIEDRGLEFKKDGTWRDTEWIIDAYEEKIEQYADYYNENY